MLGEGCGRSRASAWGWAGAGATPSIEGFQTTSSSAWKAGKLHLPVNLRFGLAESQNSSPDHHSGESIFAPLVEKHRPMEPWEILSPHHADSQKPLLDQ